MPVRPTVCVSLPVADVEGGGRRARHTLAEVLRGWDGVDEDTRDAVELLGSELITNALAHAAVKQRGSRAIHLRVLLLADHIRVDVDDPDPTAPVRAVPAEEADPLAENGRGLLTVERLAKEWGVRRRADGKTVWFSYPLSEPREPRPGQAADGRSGTSDGGARSDVTADAAHGVVA